MRDPRKKVREQYEHLEELAICHDNVVNKRWKFLDIVHVLEQSVKYDLREIERKDRPADLLPALGEALHLAHEKGDYLKHLFDSYLRPQVVVPPLRHAAIYGPQPQ
ncbi:hypothetical protein JCM3766R1_001833 [Sporobolomyces carnicolor]